MEIEILKDLIHFINRKTRDYKPLVFCFWAIFIAGIFNGQPFCFNIIVAMCKLPAVREKNISQIIKRAGKPSDWRKL